MSDNNGSFYKGLFFGAVLGAAAGILLAPEDGKKNREVLKKKVDKAKRDFGPVLEEISKKAAEINKDLEPTIKDVKNKISEVKQEVEKKSAPIVKEVEKEVKKAEQAVGKIVLNTRPRYPRFFKGTRKK